MSAISARTSQDDRKKSEESSGRKRTGGIDILTICTGLAENLLQRSGSAFCSFLIIYRERIYSDRIRISIVIVPLFGKKTVWKWGENWDTVRSGRKSRTEKLNLSIKRVIWKEWVWKKDRMQPLPAVQFKQTAEIRPLVIAFIICFLQ